MTGPTEQLSSITNKAPLLHIMSVGAPHPDASVNPPKTMVKLLQTSVLISISRFTVPQKTQRTNITTEVSMDV